MFKTSFRTTIGLLLLLVLWPPVSVGAQPRFQERVTGTCAGSSAIRQINADGTVVCEANVTSVTASAPLVSSGGATPNISLPNVTIDPVNTAIGSSAQVPVT